MDSVECARRYIRLYLAAHEATDIGDYSARMNEIIDVVDEFYSGGEAARPGSEWLRQLLLDEEQPPLARSAAIEMLRESVFQTEATPDIVANLHTGSAAVRRTAVASVRFLGRPAAESTLGAIERMATGDPSEDVRRAANKALPMLRELAGGRRRG